MYMEQVINTAQGIISFKLIRKKIKYIRIRVTGDGVVTVSAPAYISKSVISAFITQNAPSILKRLRKIEEQRRSSYPTFYKDGDTFLFLGNRMTLKVENAARAGTKMDEGALTLYVPKNKTAKQVFMLWASKTAHLVLSQRIAALSGEFAEHDIKLSVRKMLTRWGSINTQRRTISLTVHLLRCEIEVIDYVITHEFCHLLHSRHSKAFYAELDKRYANRHFYDKKLLEYGLVDF